MVFIVSSMLSGACATPEFLMYLNYFIGQEYGPDYYRDPDRVVDLSLKRRTLDKVITDCFEQVVYSINQPTGARNFQAVFWNIAYYDRYYFESLFGNFFFPDGSRPDWDSLDWLQRRFMRWFNDERTKTVLTFPVETMALLSENGDVKDKEYGELTAEMYAAGHSFFTYMSDNADSLSSCCRLRNEIQDNGFSYTLGAGGVSTGSKSVLTVNLNRCIQYAVRNGRPYTEFLEDVVDRMHKFQLAYNENLKHLQSKGMLPLFDAGYITMGRQYLTIGVNGLVEAAEFLGIEISDNPQYAAFVQDVLGIVEKYNKQYRTADVLFNCEMIPAENVGVKHAKWDREDGYVVPRDCYNSYFYAVEDPSLNVLDKFRLHGRRYVEHLTGGSALHMNLDEHLSKAQYRQLLRVAAREGTNYFTFNIPNTVCNDCGHIDKRYLKECPVCHSGEETLARRDLDLYQVALLDVDLDTMNGISLGRQLRERSPEICLIYISAYLEFAPEGYTVQAFRYILKRDLERMLPSCLEALFHEKIARSRKVLTIRQNRTSIELPYDSIYCLESDLRKVNVYGDVPHQLLCSYYGKLTDLPQALFENGFLRVGRSDVVNMRYIRQISGYKVTMRNGVELSVSRNGYAAIRETYLEWKGQFGDE